MTTGEWIILAIFGIGILCSLSLFFWLLRIVRRDKRGPHPVKDNVNE